MKAVVTAPFKDVFGIPHAVGDVINISEYGWAKYDGFVRKPEQKQEAKKSGRKRKSDAPAEAESTNQN